MTTRDDVLIDVGPPDERNRRLVIARHNGWERRDRLDTDSDTSRSRFISKVGRKLEIDVADLDGLHDEIIAAAAAADAEVDATTHEAHAAGEDEGDRVSKATQLVNLAEGDELFHDADGNAYASTTEDSIRQTWPLGSRQYRIQLQKRFYERFGKTPGGSAVQEALEVLTGKALFAGRTYSVATRVGKHQGAIYLDLANERWEAVEITPDGWRIVPQPPVRFRRARAMLEIPRPVVGGSVEELRRFINLGDDDDANQWALIVGWLVGTLNPDNQFPILCLGGEQGSAKTTVAEMLRCLVDPNSALTRADPREPRDLIVAANNSWVISLDNLSSIPPWLSDALCRLSTGGGFSTRELFSDGEEFIFAGQRPCILNGIGELATRGDLMDRALPITLASISEKKRRSKRELWREFDEARPRILGALLDAASAALRNLPETELPRLPRMADFALWVTAAEPTLGWATGTFIEAYSANRVSANESVLEASPVTRVLRDFASRHNHWKGTPTELQEELDGLANDATKRRKGWPSTAAVLSNTLRRLAPNLRADGVDVTFGRTGKRRHVTISTTPEIPVTSVTGVTEAVSHALKTTSEDGLGDANGDGRHIEIGVETAAGDAGDGGDDEIPTLVVAGDPTPAHPNAHNWPDGQPSDGVQPMVDADDDQWESV